MYQTCGVSSLVENCAPVQLLVELSWWGRRGWEGGITNFWMCWNM